jgi:hypothetical protein
MPTSILWIEYHHQYLVRESFYSAQRQLMRHDILSRLWVPPQTNGCKSRTFITFTIWWIQWFWCGGRFQQYSKIICVNNLKSNKSLKFFSGWLQLLMLRNIWLEQNCKHGTSNAQMINSIKLWSQTVKLLRIHRHINKRKIVIYTKNNGKIFLLYRRTHYAAIVNKE